MTADQLISLWHAGGWVPVATFIVGLLVRLMKDDTKIPVNLPKKWRPYVAIALGVALGVIEKIAAGSTWKTAVGGGLLAGGFAIVGHVFGIEVLRGGKEIPIPGLMKSDDNAPPKPPVLPLLALGALMLLGCPPAAKSPSAQAVAALAVNSVALGVRIANEACRDRAQAIFVEGDKQRSLELANKCTAEYKTARAALMAAAYAIDGWSDAENHGKALCALSEATTALSLTVEALKAGGVWTPPREVAVALGAAAVLGEMVEGKQCQVHP